MTQLPHRLGLPLLAILLTIAPLQREAHAERPNLPPSQLRQLASDVVVGVVESVKTSTENKNHFRYTHFVYTVRVERVDKGDVELIGEAINAAAWRRAWIGRGGPPAAAYGHRGLPDVGDRVLMHLERRESETDDRPLRIVGPNGARLAPSPVSTEVTFKGHGGVELSGTLLVPGDANAAQRVAAALLLPGSGPTDRDGNQLPQVRTDLLRTIAEALADHGVATLRFDKRATMRHAGEWPREPEALANFFALEHFVADAAAAIATLAEESRVDPSRIVVVGHSEGGLITLAMGTRRFDPVLRGAALLATAGRTLDVVMREQIVRNLDESGVAPALRTPIMDSFDSTVAALRDDRRLPEEIHPMLASLFNPSTERIMHDYITTDPIELARAFSGSVLVVNGDKDIQVSAERDAPRLLAALRSREAGSETMTIVSDVGHNFKPVDRSDRFNFTGPMSPRVLTVLIDWIQGATAP